MNSVSSAEFVRAFAKIRREMNGEPIFISHHGEPTHVLCDIQTFQKMQLCPTPEKSCSDCDIGKFELAEWIEEGIIACDKNLRIIYANRTAHALTHRSIRTLGGSPLFLALPELQKTLVELQVRQTLQTFVSNKFDLPSPFRKDTWIRFKTFILGDYIVLRMHDITETFAQISSSRKCQSVAEAVEAHQHVSRIFLNLRGAVQEADEKFATVIGLSEPRLHGVVFVNLVSKADRLRFNAALELAEQTGGAFELAISLLANDGALKPFDMAITSSASAYHSDGVVLLLTPSVTIQETLGSDE